MLPEAFLTRMEKMLGEEYEAFLASYQEPETLSLRANLLKGSSRELADKTDFLLEEVPWAEGGFYYKEGTRPGKHPYHEAGAYYIQEASAMAPAEALSAHPGERVLDLCAAPGGKSTQIGAAMKGEGLLVCNEIHPARARILSENIERMGIRNALVLSHEPAVLAECFPEFFDRILVDAPCSGEGMFRKSEDAQKEWSTENVKGCAKRQADILDQAARMLKPGGRMVYSTCTFSTEENEGTVAAFLERHPEFGPKESARFWPHKVKGEGHFLSCLQKKDGFGKKEKFLSEKGIPKREYVLFDEFRKQYLESEFEGTYVKFGEQLYLLPEGAPALKGLKVLRPGLHLGMIRRDRFEPAHSLALYLKPEKARYRYEISLEQAERYLKGETFPAEGEKGWYLITTGGYSLGWGKLSGQVMKNHYPKGLRK